MILSARQHQMLDLIRKAGAARVEDMSARFAVSTQTIRRDLNELCAAGYARRIHGGARAVDSNSVSSMDYRQRRDLNRESKQAIARRVAQLIPDQCSLMLNIGTTTEQVARALAGHRDLVVISNNINIITTLIGTDQRELIMVGGAVRPSDGAVVGGQAAEFISRYKVDYAVIGCSSIEEDGAVLDFDAREVSVARAMLEHARARVLVFDASKFSPTAPMRICNLDALDFVITDRPPPPAFMEAAATTDTQVLIADTPADTGEPTNTREPGG
jgi:DeoR family transcriptional regulator, glycerol-3-phosphate regulon repressor